ncbi:hypothetical protein FE257_006678 [Aspergillus nanangensis]|uniref:Nudix hydrolase domain-containing protein n=1 Tax=Aspergillus nanangensis TaxID=2582783 RepID=A0AAD4CQJ9_ASPNN|nr:hypothetical protein FE257_006678 [Aspergillus nanangensis]
MEPKVGISVFAQNKSGKFVLGKRQGSFGSGSPNFVTYKGTWGLPGGHLEFGESFETCAARGVLQETGLDVRDLRILTVMNSVMPAEGRHYAVVFLAGYISEGEERASKPRILEPEMCAAWEWLTWDELRFYDDEQMRSDGPGFMGRRLFSPLLELLQQWPELHV